MKYFVGWNDDLNNAPFREHPFKAIPLSNIREQFLANGGGIVDIHGEIYTGGTPDIWAGLEGSLFDQIPDLERFWSEYNAACKNGDSPKLGDEIAGAILTRLSDDEKEALADIAKEQSRQRGYESGLNDARKDSPDKKLEDIYTRILNVSINAGVTPDRASESASYITWALAQILEHQIKEHE